MLQVGGFPPGFPPSSCFVFRLLSVVLRGDKTRPPRKRGGVASFPLLPQLAAAWLVFLLLLLLLLLLMLICCIPIAP